MLDNKVIIILGAAGTIGSLLSIYIINNFNFEKFSLLIKMKMN